MNLPTCSKPTFRNLKHHWMFSQVLWFGVNYYYYFISQKKTKQYMVVNYHPPLRSTSEEELWSCFRSESFLILNKSLNRAAFWLLTSFANMLSYTMLAFVKYVCSLHLFMQYIAFKYVLLVIIFTFAYGAE